MTKLLVCAHVSRCQEIGWMLATIRIARMRWQLQCRNIQSTDPVLMAVIIAVGSVTPNRLMEK